MVDLERGKEVFTQRESIAADWDLLLNELRFRKDLKWAKQESLLRFVRFQNVSHSNRGRTLRYEIGVSGWSRRGKLCGIEFV